MPSLREIFLGQRTSDVGLPSSLTEAQRQRRALLAQLTAMASGQGQTPGEQAALAAGQAQTEAAARDIQALVNSARGTNRAGALLQALNAQAAAAQGIAGQTARTAAEARAMDIARAQQQEQALLGDIEQGATLEEEQRKRRAKGGLLPGLLSLGGAGLGALYGGGAGAAKGAQIGGTAGSTLSNIFG